LTLTLLVANIAGVKMPIMPSMPCRQGQSPRYGRAINWLRNNDPESDDIDVDVLRHLPPFPVFQCKVS
jgi:hypothetical protein